MIALIPLIIGNILVWSKARKLWKSDHEINETFDQDLYDLSIANDPIVGNPRDEYYEDLILKQEFSKLLDKKPINFLWEEGIINPEEYILVSGFYLEPLSPKDLELMQQIADESFLSGFFEDIPLEDGGRQRLYRKWFMLKGTSEDGAQRLMDQGIKPWEFEY